MLVRAGIMVAFLAPALAFAASNDVTLTTDTVLSVGGITLNITGSSATVESITVNTLDFSFNLQSGSTIQVTAPNGNILTADTATDRTITTCDSSASLMKYVGTAARTVSITPTGSICGGGGSSGGGGGGGGGSSATPATPATPAIPATQTDSGCVAGNLFSTTTGKACVTPATPATPAIPASPSAQFTSNLTIGSQGNEVRALQIFLNTHGYLIASSGPGSLGNETTTFGGLTRAAVIAYQKAKGIAPAIGYVGPLTRTQLNADQQTGSSVSAPEAPATTTPTTGGTFGRDLKVGTTGSDVRALQQYLNSHGSVVAASGPGSVGQETEGFGALTKAAVARFQAAAGITPATGYFGPITRAYIVSHP